MTDEKIKKANALVAAIQLTTLERNVVIATIEDKSGFSMSTYRNSAYRTFTAHCKDTRPKIASVVSTCLMLLQVTLEEELASLQKELSEL
jgi:hypothetical protein